MSALLAGPPLPHIDDDTVDAALSVFNAAASAPRAAALVAGGQLLDFQALAAAARHQPVPRTVTARGDLATATALYAALAAKQPVAIFNPRTPAAERAALAATLPAKLPADTAVVLFTSGSSGRPKGVLLSRRALAASALASGSVVPWAERDRWLCCLSPAHVGGLAILVRCLAARQCAVLVDGFRPDAVRAALDEHHITLCSLVPTMLDRLLDHPSWRPPPSLRALILGGAPAPAPLLARAAERGVPAVPSYGMTETCAQIYTGGRVLAGTELRVGPGDRVQVRGSTLLSGYVGAAAPIDAEGWFSTSDRGVIDGGRLVITGRADDVIVTGGVKVDPRAVERAIESLPGVRAACAFAVPDPRWGQLVAVAAVAPASALAPAAIAAQLPSSSRPRLVATVDELPVGATGKLDRRAAARVAGPLLRPIDYR